MAIFYNQATLTYNGITKSSNVTVGEITEALAVAKTAVRDTYSPGDSLVYSVSIVNSGSTAVSGVILTDDLGEYDGTVPDLVPLTYTEGTLLYYVNGQLQPAPTVTSSSPLTIEGINIPANGSAVLIYETTVNEYAPPEAGGSITNNVVISDTTEKTVLGTASETVTAAVGAELDISKSVSPLTVEENGRVTYTFVITNTGNEAAGADDNIVLTDVFSPVLSGLAVAFNGEAWNSGTQYSYDQTTGTFSTTPGVIIVPAAEFTENEQGGYTVTPGTVTLTVEGSLTALQQQPVGP